MPPTRTVPPAKPVKTERTHEENQERAYIAASRRSDRSLEARVESARRASEIHKRRTGRGLKVTEQDVVNEEMYEEEDDDLPMAYRRLTAHIQTGSPDFNRRLAAYLTSNVAMRSALEQTIQSSYHQQQFNQGQGYPPNMLQFPDMSPQYGQFPSPMYAHQQRQPTMMQPLQSPSYRQQPYPSPNPSAQAGFQTTHQRSQSIATPQDGSNSSTQSPAPQHDSTRRSSMPTNSASPDASTPTSSTSGSSKQRPSFPPGSFGTPSQELLNRNHLIKPEPQTNTELHVKTEHGYTSNVNQHHNSMWPLSTNLPANAQGLLSGSMGFPNDPLTNNLMMGSQMNTNYWGCQQPYQNNYGQTNPTMDGLTSTLAGQGPSMDDESESNLNANYFNDAFISGNKGVSGTPGVQDWDSFIEDNAWDIPSTQTSQ